MTFLHVLYSFGIAKFNWDPVVEYPYNLKNNQVIYDE